MFDLNVFESVNLQGKFGEVALAKAVAFAENSLFEPIRLVPNSHTKLFGWCSYSKYIKVLLSPISFDIEYSYLCVNEYL